MRRKDKQQKSKLEDRQDVQQSVDDFFDPETGQPVPQPKDYEEIDY